MEELFNGQLSFADIEAEKYLQLRRAHADRRVNAMDRLTDDVINELIQLCLPHYHIKAGETVQQGRPYTRLETMVRVHLLQVSLNLSDPEMESYLGSSDFLVKQGARWYPGRGQNWLVRRMQRSSLLNYRNRCQNLVGARRKHTRPHPHQVEPDQVPALQSAAYAAE